MKYLKKKKKNHLPLMICVGAFVAVAVIALVMISGNGKKQPGQTVNGTVGTDAPFNGTVPKETEAIHQTETVAPETTTAPETTLPALEPASVVTPYGVLYYPANWEECFSAKTVKGDNYLVTFYGTVDGVELPLFSVTFGNESAEGHLFGTVPGPDGETAEVRVNVIEFQPEENWSDEMTNTFYSMQEEVNSVIAQIYELPGFSVAD